MNEKSETVKKGRASWRPASDRLNVIKKKPGWRYRWCLKDDMSVEKKQAEQWQLVNQTTGIPAEHDTKRDVPDGKPLDGTKTYRELVLMALPEEVGLERDRYIAEQTDRQERGIKNALQDDLSKADKRAVAHGKIVIE